MNGAWEKIEDVSGTCRGPLSVLIGLLGVFLVVTATVGVALGPTSVSFGTVWKIVTNHLFGNMFHADWDPGHDNIVWSIRSPRVILGAFVGAGLAVVGAVLQAATRNALVDPYLFGISAGAALGAVTVIVHTGNVFGAYSVPMAAFVGALLALLMVLGIASRGGGVRSDQLILAGVAVYFVLMGLTFFLIFLGDQRASHSVVFWMLGGLGLARWSHLWVPGFVLLAGLAYLLIHARTLNAMMTGDEAAATLGIEVGRERFQLFTISALITGTMVALSGGISFVGIMVPHMVRFFVGGDNRRVLPLCALVGAIFLIWVDAGARMALAPQEIPIGIITGALGGGFFIALMWRKMPL